MDKVQYKEKSFEVKYKHNRLKDWDGVMSKGGHTEAYVELDRWVSVTAVARCSVKDTYSKKAGRALALVRLQEALTQLS